MQRLIILIIMIYFCRITGISQDTLYMLHPVVGEIIDLREKIDYLLFTDILDSNFNYCYIKPTGSKYILHTCLQTGSVIYRDIDTLEIQEYKTNIYKLNEYYTHLLKIDSLSKQEKEIKMNKIKSTSSYQAKKDIIDAGTVEKLNDESRSDRRLKEDAEMQRLYEQGSTIDNTGNIIDLDLRKKRKKKD